MSFAPSEASPYDRLPVPPPNLLRLRAIERGANDARIIQKTQQRAGVDKALPPPPPAKPAAPPAPSFLTIRELEARRKSTASAWQQVERLLGIRLGRSAVQSESCYSTSSLADPTLESDFTSWDPSRGSGPVTTMGSLSRHHQGRQATSYTSRCKSHAGLPEEDVHSDVPLLSAQSLADNEPLQHRRSAAETGSWSENIQEGPGNDEAVSTSPEIVCPFAHASTVSIGEILMEASAPPPPPLRHKHGHVRPNTIRHSSSTSSIPLSTRPLPSPPSPASFRSHVVPSGVVGHSERERASSLPRTRTKSCHSVPTHGHSLGTSRKPPYFEGHRSSLTSSRAIEASSESDEDDASVRLKWRSPYARRSRGIPTSLPFPSQPFPSRPRSARSIESARSNAFSTTSSLPPSVDSIVPETTRWSIASGSSTDSSPFVFRGSQFLHDSGDERSDAGESSPTSVSDHKEGERPMRLAEFLDEMAQKMEGGKSLMMLHPEAYGGESRPAKSLADIARDSSTRLSSARPPPSRLSSYSSSSTSIELPRPTSSAQSRVSRYSTRTCESAYFTPRHSMLDGETTGTLLPSPPAVSSTSEDNDAMKAEKMRTKRMRVVQELIETEATFASDLAVVRDIYLARAKGADMDSIAEHVMISGLGLGTLLSDLPPTPKLEGVSPKVGARRPTLVRRISGPGPALNTDSVPILANQDIHVIFSNISEIAQFAEVFAEALEATWSQDGEGDESTDRIGEVFLDMLSRIQDLYSHYCSRHHRGIMRLQELAPVLETYLAECKALSNGRTKAWDLASLLIKPVQRCLKYPLLLQQILAVTPASHRDRVALEQAHRNMLTVAEHINEVKRRTDLVNRIVDPSSRRESAASSFGRTVTKKLLRSSQKAKTAVGLSQRESDDMFDTLAGLVDSTRSSVMRFSTEMKDWSAKTKLALEAQVRIVESWIQVYAPLVDEARTVGAGHERLCVYLESCLRPIINVPFRELDAEVRTSLLVKTDHLLSLFENPLKVIAKRNDKALDHSRFLAKRLQADKRGSEEFLNLSAQLLEELPRFLGHISKYFNIIVSGFAKAQASYHHAVQELWSTFADKWFSVIPAGDYSNIEKAFASEHQPAVQIMETLAAGLGVTISRASGSSASGSAASMFSHGRPSLSSRSSSDISQDSQRYRQSVKDGRGGFSRASIASTSSMASIPSPGLLSPIGPVSPFHRDTDSMFSPDYSMQSADHAVLARVEEDLVAPLEQYVRPPPVPSLREASRVVSRLSIYAEDPRESNGYIGAPVILYTAEAVAASAAGDMMRGQHPVLSFAIGDLFFVEIEEADDPQGGSGWLGGRLANGTYGWGRTEDFVLFE